MKLTDKQREALREISVGRVKMVQFGTGANRITGPVAPTVVGRVIALGLARWPNGPFGNQTCAMTEEGWAVMSREGLTVPLTHPIPIGSTVISVEGEWDSDDDNRRRETGPMARGIVATATNSQEDGCGWVYGVTFPESDVAVQLIQRADRLDDPAYYRFEVCHV